MASAVTLCDLPAAERECLLQMLSEAGPDELQMEYDDMNMNTNTNTRGTTTLCTWNIPPDHKATEWLAALSAAAYTDTSTHMATSSLLRRDAPATVTVPGEARSLRWTVRMVDDILTQLCRSIAEGKGAACGGGLYQYTFEYCTNRFGLGALVESTVADVVYNCQRFCHLSAGCELFASFLTEGALQEADLRFFAVARSHTVQVCAHHTRTIVASDGRKHTLPQRLLPLQTLPALLRKVLYKHPHAAYVKSLAADWARGNEARVFPSPGHADSYEFLRFLLAVYGNTPPKDFRPTTDTKVRTEQRVERAERVERTQTRQPSRRSAKGSAAKPLAEVAPNVQRGGRVELVGRTGASTAPSLQASTRGGAEVVRGADLLPSTTKTPTLQTTTTTAALQAPSQKSRGGGGDLPEAVRPTSLEAIHEAHDVRTHRAGNHPATWSSSLLGDVGFGPSSSSSSSSSASASVRSQGRMDRMDVNVPSSVHYPDEGLMCSAIDFGDDMMTAYDPDADKEVSRLSAHLPLAVPEVSRVCEGSLHSSPTASPPLTATQTQRSTVTTSPPPTRNEVALREVDAVQDAQSLAEGSVKEKGGNAHTAFHLPQTAPREPSQEAQLEENLGRLEAELSELRVLQGQLARCSFPKKYLSPERGGRYIIPEVDTTPASAGVLLSPSLRAERSADDIPSTWNTKDSAFDSVVDEQSFAKNGVNLDATSSGVQWSVLSKEEERNTRDGVELNEMQSNTTQASPTKTNYAAGSTLLSPLQDSPAWGASDTHLGNRDIFTRQCHTGGEEMDSVPAELIAEGGLLLNEEEEEEEEEEESASEALCGDASVEGQGAGVGDTAAVCMTAEEQDFFDTLSSALQRGGSVGGGGGGGGGGGVAEGSVVPVGDDDDDGDDGDNEFAPDEGDADCMPLPFSYKATPAFLVH